MAFKVFIYSREGFFGLFVYVYGKADLIDNS